MFNTATTSNLLTGSNYGQDLGLTLGINGGSGTLLSSPSTTSTITFNTPLNYLTNQTNTIMQNKVAVFKVTRDEDNKITNTEFIKELWVQTKNNQSVDFQVARDKDLAQYEANDLIIKTILTVTF